MTVEVEGQQRLLEGLDGIAWVADAHTLRPLFVSRRAHELLGPHDRELLTQVGDRLVNLCRAVADDGRSRTFEHELGPRWFRTEVHLLGTHRLLGLMHDITRLKHTEQALRERERGLELLLAQLPVTVWTTDRDLFVTSLRGRGLARLGLGSLSVVGKPLMRVLRTRDPDFEPVRRHRQALAGEPTTFDFQWQDAIFHVAVEPYTSATGELIGTIGVALDVTEKRRVQARLAEAQRLAHLGSFEWDVATNHVTWTDELARIFGLRIEDVGGTYQSYLERVHPDDRERVAQAVACAVRDGIAYEMDKRIVRPDGSVRILESRGAPVRDETGKVVRLIGTCLDVTELRHAEQERARTTSLLRATLEATGDGILVVDIAGEITAYNQMFLDLFQLPPDLTAKQSLDLVRGELRDPEAFMRRVAWLLEHPEVESIDHFEFTDGRVYERRSYPQRVGPRIVGRVLCFRDITERRRVEAERDRLLKLEQESRVAAERALAVRGEFLSVAAHEVRGPVTSIQLAIQSLRAGGLSSEQIAHVLEVAERQAQKLSRFVDELLDAARIESGRLTLEREAVDLAQVARDVAARFELQAVHARSPLQVRTPVPMVGQWDRLRLEQVVSNLISNAIKFGAGHPIEIDVGGDPDVARLSVADHGIGIPPARHEEIFELFERAVSSRHYGGLGLGLYIVRRIVRALGGTVRVDSAEGEGARFTVELPRGLA